MVPRENKIDAYAQFGGGGRGGTKSIMVFFEVAYTQ